jgi:hypothetical protein
MSSRFTASANLNAAIERVGPGILALLADGVPRAGAAIVAALAGRHPKDDVTLTLMHLAILGQLSETPAGMPCRQPGGTGLRRER